MTGPRFTRGDAALLGRAVVNCLFPRRCPYCDRVLGFAPECTRCGPVCQRLEWPGHTLSPGRHHFGRLAGAFTLYGYEDAVRKSILRMKYQGCRWYAPELGNAMAKTLFGCTLSAKYGIILPNPGSAAAVDWDVIVPVPASGKGRGYNIPYLLAKPIARGLGLPILQSALRRGRTDRPQARLSAGQRLLNAKGAFLPGMDCSVQGLRVLLVDDVITTGATAAACADALLLAGAKSVWAVSLAASTAGEDEKQKSTQDENVME